MGNTQVVTVILAVIVLRESHAAELCLAEDFDSQFEHVLRSQLLPDDRIRNMSSVLNDLENMLRVQWPVLRVSHVAELCLAGDFESQFAHVLRSQLLPDDRIRNMSRVLNDLENMLRVQWPGAVVMPFGSLVIGLGLQSSDTDCYVELPQRDSDRDTVIKIIKLMKQYPTKYQNIYPHNVGLLPVINFFHAPTQASCDLSFKGPTVIENCKLVKYYMFMDERVRPVTAFLKIWSKVHGITGANMLKSYGLALLAIFFFQQKRILPPTSVLQRNAATHYVDGWNTGFDRLPYETTNTESIYELVRDFFDYYSEFNFEDYMVSPYAGRPIRKRDFSDVDTVPEEFVLYKRRVREHSCEPATFDTKLWVQDVYDHAYNMNKGRNPSVSEQFIFNVKLAAKSFSVLPKDRVLRAILVKRKQ